jgi:hypothetical protein
MQSSAFADKLARAPDDPVVAAHPTTQLLCPMRVSLDVREPPDGTGLIGNRSTIERNQIWHPKSVYKEPDAVCRMLVVRKSDGRCRI